MKNKLIERRSSFEFAEDEKKIYGYALVFEQESNFIGWYEYIKRGSITEELINNSDIILNFEHDDTKMLARSVNGEGTLRLNLDEHGLYFECDVPDTQLGKDIYFHIKNGNLFECSFAFSIPDDPACERWYYNDKGDFCRDIYNIDGIYDCAVVTRAAYSETSVGIRKRNNKLAFNELTKINNSILKNLDDKYSEFEEEINKYIID